MMAEEQAVVVADSAPEEGGGKYEPPIIDVCDRAAQAALLSVCLRWNGVTSLDCWVDGHTTKVLREHWDALLLAGAESCERRSFTPPAVFNRWLARLSVEERETLGFCFTEAEPYFDLYAALLSRMWGWVTRRRMLAERRAEQAERPPERLRWEDAEPELQRLFGVTHWQPPDTPEKREALLELARRWRHADGRQRKALQKWIGQWKKARTPEERAKLIRRMRPRQQ